MHKFPMMSECLSANHYHGDTVIVCPICKNPNTHIQAVAVKQGIRVDVITKSETIRRAHDDLAGSECGAIVYLTMWCEEGHEFETVLRFHKGATIISCEANDEVSGLHTEELWRD